MLKQLLDGVANAMEVFDSLDDRTDLPLDTVEFLLSAFVVALAHSIQPVQLAVILGGKFLGELPGIRWLGALGPELRWSGTTAAETSPRSIRSTRSRWRD